MQSIPAAIVKVYEWQYPQRSGVHIKLGNAADS